MTFWRWALHSSMIVPMDTILWRKFVRHSGMQGSRDIDKYFLNYKLLQAFLIPNQLNNECAKWVKFNETSRSKP